VDREAELSESVPTDRFIGGRPVKRTTRLADGRVAVTFRSVAGVKPEPVVFVDLQDYLAHLERRPKTDR